MNMIDKAQALIFIENVYVFYVILIQKNSHEFKHLIEDPYNIFQINISFSSI